MTIKSMKIAGALVLMGAAANASALGISLVANGPTDDLMAGDVIDVRVVMDFSTEATLGGGFNIVYDTAELNLLGFTSFNIGTFENRDPDILDGELSAWAFSDFGGLTGPLDVGTVQFEVLGGIGGDINVFEDIGGIGGAFTSAVTFLPYEPGQLTFEGVSYTVAGSQIPVPAAVWFMLSGLGALFGFGRRKAA